MFDVRNTATEFLDRPDCDPALAAASYRFMEVVNSRFGGCRLVRRFLAAETGGHRVATPLRILDIGSGSCDIPLALSQWARTHDLPLHFTCLEMADHAIDIARQQLARTRNSAVELLQEDVFTHDPAEPYDCAVASMCFHHFSDDQILALVQRLRRFVRKSLLINDLRRSPMAGLAARLLLTSTRAPAGVRHDALLSIRRGFRVHEMKALLGQLDGTTATVAPALWFRIAAIVRFTPKEKP